MKTRNVIQLHSIIKRCAGSCYTPANRLFFNAYWKAYNAWREFAEPYALEIKAGH